MTTKVFVTAVLLLFPAALTCQTDTNINKTDAEGKKQGPWIKKYTTGLTQYEGVFKDDHPVGEFKRYYENGKLKSLFIFSYDGKEALATVYHPNGFVSSKGRYIDQMKEGKWLFYSSDIEGSLVSEEEYKNNLRDGLSVKYHPGSIVAEKLTYVNNRREGEWLQFHPDGSKFLKSSFTDDKLNGKFEVWFEDGTTEISGAYRNNKRDGTWLFYNREGNLLYKMDYIDGITNDHQMETDISNYLDYLEKNSVNISDPEKTGEIR